jgi:hypothetical protein
MNKGIYILFLTAVIFLQSVICTAQAGREDTTTDNTADLEKILNKGLHVTKKTSGFYTSATFQSTRIINGQSIENTGKGVLEFRIAHRFGQLNEGVKNLYGLDNATTKFSFDYGLTDWLCAGIGRSSFEKEYDGFIKVKLIRQRIDGHNPVSVSYAGTMSVRTLDVVNIPGYTYYFSNRLYFANQILVARKFNKVFSLQLTPTYLHYNLVVNEKEPNDVFAIGAGGRIKISKRIAITGEYYYTVPGHKLDGYRNSVSLGVDIVTGGHVFQLFMTNAAAISERTFIGQTTGDISKGDIHLGFNISRVFTVVKSKGFRDKSKEWK